MSKRKDSVVPLKELKARAAQPRLSIRLKYKEEDWVIFGMTSVLIFASNCVVDWAQAFLSRWLCPLCTSFGVIIIGSVIGIALLYFSRPWIIVKEEIDKSK